MIVFTYKIQLSGDKVLWNLNRMQKEPEEVQVEVGEQCCKPYA